jgi:hypothetical protein
MPDAILCDLCARAIPAHCHYIVRIEIFADPSMPPVTAEEIAKMDFDQTLTELLKEMESMSAEELEDQVHRSFEYRLCRACQIRFLANPLGKPRRVLFPARAEDGEKN